MDKKVFVVEFTGYCEIAAENETEAEEIFWKDLPTVGENDVWDVESVEELDD